jgi:hypothetical protein
VADARPQLPPWLEEALDRCATATTVGIPDEARAPTLMQGNERAVLPRCAVVTGDSIRAEGKGVSTQLARNVQCKEIL